VLDKLLNLTVSHVQIGISAGTSSSASSPLHDARLRQSQKTTSAASEKYRVYGHNSRQACVEKMMNYV